MFGGVGREFMYDERKTLCYTRLQVYLWSFHHDTRPKAFNNASRYIFE
jgi:hypothetical protein